MLSHDKAQALISARYDQLLTPAETRDLQEHLATCADCRRFAAETDLLVHGLRTLPQLPPSPRVSRAVRTAIGGAAGSPWGWLGQALRIAGSPALAVASSLVLVAALAFIIVLALQPLELNEEPRATISALADVIETPTTEPGRTPVTAPTVAPTEPAVVAPTQEPTPAPTPRLTNVTPPTQTPVPPTAAAPTTEPTQQPIVTREQATEPPVVETPEPTVAPPPVPEQEAPSVEDVAPTQVIEAANQAVSAEPTAPPISATSDGAPFTSEQAVATEDGSAPPAYAQPTIGPGGPEGGAVLEPEATEPAADDVVIAPEPVAATTSDAGEPQAADAQADAEATVPPVAPTSTPVEIVAAESAPAAAPPVTAGEAEAPQLPERDGNEAIGMDGDAMVAAIQATVQAGLTDDSGPPAVPTSSAPPPASASQAGPAATAPTGAAGDAGVISPAGAEITGAPASESLVTGAEPTAAEAPPVSESAPLVTDAAPVTTDPAAAAVAPVPTEPPLEQVPVAPQVIGAPDPGWPGIPGGGTQLQSTAGYSAIVDGGGVTVYGPDGTPLGWAGSGSPSWSPGGTSLLVIGPDGLGAVWDANAGGAIPVERPSAPARDIPVGWYGGEPLVQRLYFDTGQVELRVVPVSGAGGYAVGTATADSVFGAGVTAARLSPDGGQISFVSGGQLYIAPVSDPGSASPAG